MELAKSRSANSLDSRTRQWGVGREPARPRRGLQGPRGVGRAWEPRQPRPRAAHAVRAVRAKVRSPECQQRLGALEEAAAGVAGGGGQGRAAWEESGRALPVTAERPAFPRAHWGATEGFEQGRGAAGSACQGCTSRHQARVAPPGGGQVVRRGVSSTGAPALCGS